MRNPYKGLPKKVRIGQRDYKVHVKNEANDPSLIGAYAYTYSYGDHIVLSDNMTQEKARATLLHELLHAIGGVYENPHAKVEAQRDSETYDAYNDRWEHYFINLFQEPLVTMLRDNPELTEFLTAE